MLNMKQIANMSISRRLLALIVQASIKQRLLFASITIAIIPGLVILLLGGLYIQALNAHGQAEQVSTDALNMATTQMATLEQMNSDLISLQGEQVVTNRIQSTYISQLEQTLNSEINILQTNFANTLTTYQQNNQLATSNDMESVRGQLANDTLNTLETDQQSALNRVVNQEWPTYAQAQSQELQALQSNQPSAYQLLLTANAKYTPLENDWNHIVALAQTVSDTVAQVNTTQELRLGIFAAIAFLIILLIVLTIGSLVYRTIVHPLHELATLTKRIGKGDTSARVAIKGSNDIYLVAESMNKMVDSLVQLTQNVQKQRDDLQEQIDDLVSEVKGIAEGNLQVQIEVLPGTLGSLRSFFQYMIEALSSLIIRVKVASSEVQTSTTATLTVLAQLAKTSKEQLQEIADATAEVGQMATSCRQVANRTHRLYDVVYDAQSASQRGRLSVQQAIAGMKRIYEDVHETSLKVQALDKHSNNINSVIAVISNIAQEMNRLAYSAIQQASQVGEHGKGFSVIASDIQRLAEQTTNQISSIARVVKGVHEDIGSATSAMQVTEEKSSAGAKLAQEAGGSLETIFAVVEYQAREMDSISQMVKQQLQYFTAIENILYLISQSTQQISVSTNKGIHQLEYLAGQVEQLRSSVEAFKLPQTFLALNAPRNPNPPPL